MDRVEWAHIRKKGGIHRLIAFFTDVFSRKLITDVARDKQISLTIFHVFLKAKLLLQDIKQGGCMFQGV